MASNAHVETLALREQFISAAQQREVATLGMWIFLITEIMFFGGLFLAYTIYRSSYPNAFAQASSSINVYWGALNTVVLLTSSFTMVMAVRGAQLGKRMTTFWFLAATLLLGLVFLGIKAIEWTDKFHEHHVPGPTFHLEGLPPGLQGQAQLFFTLYFAMTGLHALHMVVGAGIVIMMMVWTYKGRFTAEYMTPIDITGLYWHFVDIIWIFLFPLLYLIDRHLPR